MIGVAQDERGVDILEMFRREGLDCCLCANRSEDRCEKITMRGSENPGAGAVVFGGDLEFKHQRIITLPCSRSHSTNHLGLGKALAKESQRCRDSLKAFLRSSVSPW